MPSLFGRRKSAPSAERVYFLIFNANGSSGVVRTVLNLANHLADRRVVEVISVLRRGKTPHYEIDRRIKVTYLDGEPIPNESRGMLSVKTEKELQRSFESLAPGSVLITTRPVLHLAATRLAPDHLITIGQDHLNFETRMGRSNAVDAIGEALHGLDAFTVLTEADAVDYRHRFPTATAAIEVIRNAAPWPVTPPAGPDRRIVVAAGRLVEQKAFHRLIDAYTPIASSRPDWQLHIYGDGEQRDRLAQMVAERGIGDQVRLMGHTDDFEARLAEASIYAMSSRYEGFPMVLVEAMTKGVPAIAYDCPRGPAEIIADGRNGRLIPDGDKDAYTDALLGMIDDQNARQRMSVAATEKAEEYRIETIASRWEALFDELRERRRG